MRSWLLLLAGLLVWAAHFFALYAIGEFAGATPGWRWAVAALTLACLAAEIALLLRVRHAPRRDSFERWRASVAAGGLLLGAIAVAWQGLPALFG
jgi:hypothetical protein